MITLALIKAVADAMEHIGKGAALTFGALIVLRIMGVSL